MYMFYNELDAKSTNRKITENLNKLMNVTMTNGVTPKNLQIRIIHTYDLQSQEFNCRREVGKKSVP